MGRFYGLIKNISHIAKRDKGQEQGLSKVADIVVCQSPSLDLQAATDEKTGVVFTDPEEREDKEIFDKKLRHFILCGIDYFIDMIRKNGPDAMEYSLFDSGKVCQFAFFRYYKEEGKFGFLIGVRRADSDRVHRNYLMDGHSKEEILGYLGEEETRQKIVDFVCKLAEHAKEDP